MAGNVRKALGYEPSVKFVTKLLGDKIVAYYAGLARALKSVNAALMLQQCIYWQCRTLDKDGWFFKTIKDFQNELALSRYKQETAIHILIEHNLIEKRLKGIPAKRHFRVNLDKVAEFIEGIRHTYESD